MSLRKKLIRLAHANPDLRADLLPLLKKSAAKPREVRVVEEIAQANEAESSRDMDMDPYPGRIYVRLQNEDRWGEGREEYWEVADNLEQMGTLGYYRLKDGEWYYPARWGRGEPRKMPGGFHEAQGNAEIWFTG